MSDTLQPPPVEATHKDVPLHIVGPPTKQRRRQEPPSTSVSSAVGDTPSMSGNVDLARPMPTTEPGGNAKLPLSTTFSGGQQYSEDGSNHRFPPPKPNASALRKPTGRPSQVSTSPAGAIDLTLNKDSVEPVHEVPALPRRQAKTLHQPKDGAPVTVPAKTNCLSGSSSAADSPAVQDSAIHTAPGFVPIGTETTRPHPVLVPTTSREDADAAELKAALDFLSRYADIPESASILISQLTAYVQIRGCVPHRPRVARASVLARCDVLRADYRGARDREEARGAAPRAARAR